MTLWGWILLACVIAFTTKLLGWLVPAERLQRPWLLQAAGTLTVGLLASLTILNAVADGQLLRPDARLVALAAAALALVLRAPFIVVVVAGAAAAALARLAGMP
ncbi:MULTISPECIES: AzlD domain-containing protein [Desertihabitans]|uniref:AzlD domain-containing protein n=1 Tax=Desertihabitans brevis TaxID=2268447 RepID=A0A367YQS0_9ACTN|nr:MULTISPECIES: AzlD domain-containing protein [Desertihabitans]RCK68130.1 AzlD domain-containing protein [Desertihabitans brevis]